MAIYREKNQNRISHLSRCFFSTISITAPDSSKLFLPNNSPQNSRYQGKNRHQKNILINGGTSAYGYKFGFTPVLLGTKYIGKSVLYAPIHKFSSGPCNLADVLHGANRDINSEQIGSERSHIFHPVPLWCHSKWSWVYDFKVILDVLDFPDLL